MMRDVPGQKRSEHFGRTHKPFQPLLGSEFGGVDEVEAKTRGFLARGIAVSAIAAIATTGAYALPTGNVTPLMTTWAVVGPIVGAMVTYYFGPQRYDAG